MASSRPNPDVKPRRLIVNADDLGRSASINEAVIRAHREGILTTASLMVNEPACDEAVALARPNPWIGDPAEGIHQPSCPRRLSLFLSASAAASIAAGDSRAVPEVPCHRAS